MKLSFRQKILLAYAGVFLLLLALIYPFGIHTVSRIVSMGMEDRANELIEKLRSAKDDDALIRRVKEQKSQIFFRVSLIDNEHKILYDSHTKRLLGSRFSQSYVAKHPEVIEAFEKGKGYSEGYSELLGQKFAYLAKTFDFHGKTYVIRTAFPYKYLTELTRDFELGILSLSLAVLILYSLMTWFAISRLTQPIDRIIEGVKPYQEGLQNSLPALNLDNFAKNDDFGKLAYTLNSLSSKIQGHIDILTSERNEKEAILESLVEGVIATDSDSFVVFANSSAAKFLSLEPSEMVGKDLSTLGQPLCDSLVRSCQTTNSILYDNLKIKRSDSDLFLDLLAVPKRDKSGAILVIQDLSSHYKMLEMRKDFIANASHELKTPITVIRGFSETLLDNPELPKEVQSEVLGKIVRNCERMAALVRDLLALSDVENIPKSRLIECDLSEIAKKCSFLLKDVHPDVDLKLHLDENESYEILGDPNLLEMLFTNLMENAAKYSQELKQIDVTLKEEGDKIVVSIADKGIGIPEADQEHIFERFYTVDKAHSKKLGGSGLGLSIVQNIVKKHFGTITLRSQVGVGTIFTIELPKHR